MHRGNRPRDIEVCREALRQFLLLGSKTEAARVMRMNWSTYVRYLAEAQARGLKPKMTPADLAKRSQPAAPPDSVTAPVPDEPEIGPVIIDREAALEHQVERLIKKLKVSEADRNTAARIRREIFQLAESTPNPPDWTLRPGAAAGPRSAGAPLVLCSDWHWSEEVFPDQVDGVNRYDLEIARRRMRAFIENLCHVCFDHTKDPTYDGLVFCLGGDMVSGDIHQELRETNETSSAQTLLDLFDVMCWALKTLADRFGHVFVPAVAGNHGRMTHKPTMKNRAFENWDWMLACLLERHFRHDERLRFTVPDGTDAYFSLNNRRFLLTHGDSLGVKGGDGIIGVLGPILRGDFKIRNQKTAIAQPYDTLLMGHWHQYLAWDRVMVNGSGKGYDEYAKVQLRAPPEAPRQALAFVHHKRGLIKQIPIAVEDPVGIAPPKWVEIPRAA